MALSFARLTALLALAACGEHAGSSEARSQSQSESGAPATVWLARAGVNPEIAAWMFLRAASETGDSAERARIYQRVNLPVARDRIPWVEARAREHFHDLPSAIQAYRTLGASLSVFRLRAIASGEAGRDSVRRELLAFVSSSQDGETVRDGYALFDKLFVGETPVEQLAIARATAGVGAWGRARTGFEHAGPVQRLSPQDRFQYATALAHANQDSRAAELFLGVGSPLGLAGAAQYQGARSLLGAGQADRARTLLRGLSQGSDTTAAAALSLLADLASDDGNDVDSRSLLLQVAHRFPNTRFASPARFNAALIAIILGDAAQASQELASLGGSATDGIAATYWRGRVQQTLGNTSAARLAWQNVIARDSTTYYAGLAATRLGTRNMHIAPASAGYPRVAAVDSALTRIGLLRQMDMAPEALLENERLFSDAPSDSARLLATAAAFAGTDQASRAITLGRRALVAQGPSVNVFRLIYPVAVRDTIIAQAHTANIDPALVAAIIRQESSFNARATSAAGARGLMQLMPTVARPIAASAGIRPWSASMLYDPGINVTLGVRHLAPLVRSQPALPRVLAAYNAGASRVSRWARKRGADDQEMFTERIPFAETRDYVKVVLRNRGFYRVLYAW
ncbi:MAG: transglycosylase SLT domain-containing protein [Gemmatimonadaceae bacterium]